MPNMFLGGGGSGGAGPSGPAGSEVAQTVLGPGYALTAAKATSTPTDPLDCAGWTSVFFLVDIANYGVGVTSLTASFEARDSTTGSWAPLQVEDLDAATGLATLQTYQPSADVTALPDDAQWFRVPAWAKQIRMYVWAGTGDPTGSSVTVTAFRQ